jgi:multicomponent Na+:H+ antiporter subunit E
MRRVVVFVTTYVVWLLLTFPYDVARVGAGLPVWDAQSALLGLGAAAVCAIILPASILQLYSLKVLNPVRWFWALLYLPVLFYHIIAANLQVAYIVLHPDMPIRPGIVRVRTSLKTSAARTVLANSITLTPGTFTVDMDDDEGVLYIHWLTVEAEDEEGASEAIASRFEPLLKRIFE